MTKFRTFAHIHSTISANPSTDGDELYAYVVPFVIYSVLWPVGPHVVIKHSGDGCVYREF